MKQFSFIHVLLFILMLVVYHCSHAQDYVIPLKGDTIKGVVRPSGFGVNSRVQVTPAEGKKASFSVTQVRQYTYKNEIYRPIRGLTGYVFMKLIRDGYLALYGFQPENQTNYDGRFLMRKDGAGLEVPNLTFKKSVTRYLGDCAAVAEKVDNGELTKRDLEQIVDEYNNCVGQNTTTAAVEKQKLTPLDALEQKVKDKQAFQGQSDALDMIVEMKKKVQRQEKIPNFMIEGLKNALSSQADLTTDLNAAINELTQ